MATSNAVTELGEVLMQGRVRRQGEGFAGMKPWSDKFALLPIVSRGRFID
jgi:hypothetical protein